MVAGAAAIIARREVRAAQLWQQQEAEKQRRQAVARAALVRARLPAHSERPAVAQATRPVSNSLVGVVQARARSLKEKKSSRRSKQCFFCPF